MRLRSKSPKLNSFSRNGAGFKCFLEPTEILWLENEPESQDTKFQIWRTKNTKIAPRDLYWLSDLQKELFLDWTERSSSYELHWTANNTCVTLKRESWAVCTPKREPISRRVNLNVCHVSLTIIEYTVNSYIQQWAWGASWSKLSVRFVRFNVQCP